MVFLIVGSTACGGADASGLFDGPPSSEFDASVAPPSHDGGAPRDGGGVVDATRPSPVGAGTDAAADARGDDDDDDEDDAAIPDASRVDAAPPPVDAAPPPPPVVTCGVNAEGHKMTCGSTKECCNDSRQSPAFTCTALDACAASPILCGSSAECEHGDVCCGTFNIHGAYFVRVTCEATCPAATNGFNYPRFCTFNPGECPAGTTCQPSVLAGYSTCR